MLVETRNDSITAQCNRARRISGRESARHITFELADSNLALARLDTMALQEPPAEPSMEEILASIRRIISEEEQPGAAADEPLDLTQHAAEPANEDDIVFEAVEPAPAPEPPRPAPQAAAPAPMPAPVQQTAM